MNGQHIGRLTRTTSGPLRFEYDAEWLHYEGCRPLSLSMPLGPHAYSGNIVENFFDNLLPDSQPIRNRIQARFGAATNRSFDLLWHIGRDCVGALQLLPDDTPSFDVRRIEATSLTESEIAETLRNYTSMPLGMRRDGDFRISIAGAQEKAAFLHYDGRWCSPSGVTPTSHIFKLPIGNISHSNLDLTDSVENEWLSLQILKAYGLPVADAQIVTFEDVKTLIVKRFDRRWADARTWLIRLPQEDMCQALGVAPALKYEADGGPGMRPIMDLLLGSSQAIADRHLFMKAQFLFWVLGAIDGHAKNFSIHLLPGGDYCATPLYDVISAYPLMAKRQVEARKLKMAMAVRGKNVHYSWSTIQLRHWLEVARQCRFPTREMQEVISSTFERMDEIIASVGTSLPARFPEEMAASLFAGMRSVRDRQPLPHY